MEALDKGLNYKGRWENPTVYFPFSTFIDEMKNSR